MKVAGLELENARVAVMGLARSGLAAVCLLRSHGAQVTATDSKSLAELAGAAALLSETGAKFVPQSPDVLLHHDLAVISPGVPLDSDPVVEALRSGIPVIGELELASYFLLGPVIAITGSNGKTTTTSLVGHTLDHCGIPTQVGGNIGTPLASMTWTSRSDQWNVIEVSSFQLETISHFRAQIAVCLNVTPDHLDRHKTMEEYAAAKGRLFTTQQEDGFAVLNADDAACVGYAAMARSRPMWFSANRPVTPGLWVHLDEIVFDGEPVMKLADILLRGMHNVENIMAATAASRLAGAPLSRIAEAVKSFPGVEHRLEFVRKINGVDYFNDSKATNVDAALKALEAFPGRLWVILGGKDKGSDYTPLSEPLREKALSALLIGAAGPKIAGQVEGAAPLVACGTIDRAVEYAHQHAAPGDVVLLAPACASFDQFENFEHRGRVFKTLVNGLPEG